MSEVRTENSFLNYTSVITVGGILLYQLGWSYWETYLNNFNIDSSLIDISIEKIISTTWTTIILVIVALLRSIENVIKLKPNDSISVNGMILYLYFGIFIMYEVNEIIIFQLSHIGIFLVGLVILYIFEKKLNKIGPISKKKYLIILIVVGYIISFFYYPYLANKNSKKMKADYTNNIVIILNNNNKIIEGKFITFMNDKYFILVENKQCKRETLILNNSEINHVKFSTNSN